MATRSGILVAIGMYRKDAPRAAQDAAKALHARLQQNGKGADAPRVLPGLAARGERLAAVSALPGSLTVGSTPVGVAKLDSRGLIEELDEALLAQLPEEQVCFILHLRNVSVVISSCWDALDQFECFQRLLHAHAV